MTEEERLANNNRIHERGRHNRDKRKNQVCRVYHVKIDISHLNDALTLDKDKQPVTHELEHLGSQMKQSVIQDIKHSLKSLATLKKHNHVGSLRYKSDYVSIKTYTNQESETVLEYLRLGISECATILQ